MKNVFKLIGITALAAVMIFALVITACDNGAGGKRSGGGGNSTGGSGGKTGGGDTYTPPSPEKASYVTFDEDTGNKYELVITEAVGNARYTAKTGDTYVLTITDSSGNLVARSTGTVGKVETNTFELRHSSGAVITVAVSTSGSSNIITSLEIDAADGNIPVDTNSPVQIVQKPTKLTPTKIEYTDWEYVTNADGTSRITLYLDGIMVPRTQQQRVQRALNPEFANMSHDYFEAVFVDGDGAVARTSWEIGQSAGIAGVRRGIDYGSVYPTTAGASVLFVGRKASSGSGTLLDIGHLIEVREGNNILLDGGSPARNSTVITATTTSITFAVYPLSTRVGFTGPDTVYGTDATATFRTATGDTANYSTVSAGNTKGDTVNILAGNFPVYTLPDITGAALPRSVSASYRIGGLSAVTATAPSVNKPDLATSARVLADRPTSNPIGLQVIKRIPAFMHEGRIYEIVAYDSFSTVTTTNNQTNLAAFDPVMTMTFTQAAQSTGIFAITFQVPVCAITNANATNGGPTAVRWFVRPAYLQYQYLLDNGTDMGGMVMLGTGAVGSDWQDMDFIEIKTTGIGFDNE